MRMKKLAAGFMITAVLTVSCAFAGFAAEGTWQQDEKGWWYQNTDGSHPQDAWLDDSGTWYRMGTDGYMLKGWIQVGGSWYYMEPSGAMAANTTKNIDGVDYAFDASGIWKEQAASAVTQTPSVGVWEGNTFKNSWANYQITFPDGYKTSTDSDGDNSSIDYTIQDFDMNSADGFANIQIMYADMNQTKQRYTPEGFLFAFKQELIASGLYTAQEVTAVNIGGYEYKKLPVVAMGMLYQDIYCRQIDNYLMFITSSYTPGYVDEINGLLGSVKRVN